LKILITAGMIAALERGRNGERYILAGENLTRRLAELTNELLSVRKNFITFPTAIVRSLAWLGRTFHFPLPLNLQLIPTATLYWSADNSKARRELGVRFRNAESTLQATLNWCVDTRRIQAGSRRAA